MKINLLILALLAFSILSSAQCTVTLNGSTVRVTQDSTIATNLGAGQYYLVCSGATLTYAGTQSATVTYYLEENASFKSQRSHVAVVYMKANAEFDASYSESGNWAITSNAWYDASANFVDHIQGANFNECANVVYVYGSVGNCDGTASVPNHKLSESIFIYPNPASDELTVSFGDDSGKKLTLFNTLGVVALERTSLSKKCEINISNLQSGPYFLRITDENGNREVRKVIIKN